MALGVKHDACQDLAEQEIVQHLHSVVIVTA